LVQTAVATNVSAASNLTVAAGCRASKRGPTPRGEVAPKGDALVPRDDADEVTFVRFITTRSGKRIYAYQYGLRAFPIRVGRRKPDG
jgi:hypothetical protein